MYIFKYETTMNALKIYLLNYYETINSINTLFISNEGVKTAKIVK